MTKENPENQRVICELSLGDEFIGAGDGTGNRFACPDCWRRKKIKRLEEKAKELEIEIASWKHSYKLLDERRECSEKKLALAEEALEELSTYGNGIKEGSVHYKNCWSNMKYVAKEALRAIKELKK